MKGDSSGQAPELKTARDRELWFDGVPASPGIAMAEAALLEASDLEVEEKALPESQVDAEIERFQDAVRHVEADIRMIRDTTAEMLGEVQAAIFDAHVSILKDPMAYETTIHDIRAEGRNSEFLFLRNMRRAAEALEAHGDPYFRERAQDIRDVKWRVLRRLLRLPQAETRGRGIVVAHEITPSVAAQLDPARVVGLAVDLGGRTSHAAIMARARGIPAVMGLKTMSHEVRGGDMIVLDGFRGRVILNPKPDTLAEYKLLQNRHLEAERRCQALADLPPVTLDGRQLVLAGNLELPEEIDLLKERGAMGIGLFRTEFFLMRHHRLPDESVQYAAYRSAAEKVAPHAVIIRTLDVGGDKFASYLGAAFEDNPFLGMRGIRFLSDHRDLFHTQIRAAYRASAHGRIKILLPMISGLEEVRAARQLCRQVQEELKREGVPFDPGVELGVMVEVPSTVILADLLAAESEFFSIGSNDLIQYTLAVDRGSARVAHLYEPLHPAVLRSIARTVEAAHARGRWVGICGEMAADPAALVLLIGMSLDEISAGGHLLPEIKRVIREIRYADAVKWAKKAVRMSTAAEVRDFVRPLMKKLFPDLIGEAGGNGSPGWRNP